MAHRYWRLTLTPWEGGEVHLSEAWLLDGAARVDGAATLTSSASPTSGDLADLGDADTGTAVVLPAGVALAWDFGGSPQDVTDIRLGAVLSRAAFPRSALLEWSDDASSWTLSLNFQAIAWPGMRALTKSSALPVEFRAASNLLIGSGTSFSVEVPATVVDGDMLLVAVMRRGPLAAVPAGFTLLSGSPLSSNGSGTTQWTDVWGRTATAADAGAALTFEFSDTTTHNAQVLVVGARQGCTKLQYETSQAWTSVGAYQVQLPTGAATVSGNGSLAVGVAGNIFSVSGSPGVLVSVGPLPWALRTPSQVASMRLYTATKAVSAGDSLSGTFSTSMADNNDSGESSNVLVFESIPAIERSTASVGAWPILASQHVDSLGAVPSFPGAFVERVQAGRLDYNFDPQRQTGRVRGVVVIDGTPEVPVSRRVVLLRLIDWMPIAEQWSDPVTGAYDFHWVEEGQRYLPVTVDHTGVYAAVATGPMTPEPMPQGGV